MKQESTLWTSLLIYQVKCFQGSCMHVWFCIRLLNCIIWNRLKIKSWCSWSLVYGPWVFFCKSMSLHTALWTSSSFANYIFPEYISLSLNLDEVLFSFSLSLLKLYGIAKNEFNNNRSDRSPYLQISVAKFGSYLLYGQGLHKSSDFTPDQILI